jgi:hypothetical protein
MNIYEYLFTGIIIFAMLVASSTMITSISQPNQTTSDKEQLKITTQKIMTQLTLDPGNPPEWGSNITVSASDLTTFGLAEYSETTRAAYVLDPDKILHLDPNASPIAYISPFNVLSLLNLGNDYGLTIRIYPALNVTVNLAPNEDLYTVSVTTNDIGLPIVNANTAARIFYYNTTLQATDTKTNTTWIDGQCTIDFGNIASQMKVLALVVDYYGIRIIKTIPVGTGVTHAYLIDNHIPNQAASDNQVAEITVNKNATRRYMIGNVTSTSKQTSGNIDLDYLEPSTVAVLATANSTTLILASTDTSLVYSSSPAFTSSPASYSLERTVMISGSAYIMQLQMWRTSF